MEKLAEELLTYAFRNSVSQIRFPDLQCDLNKLMEQICCQAILEIKTILSNPALSDCQCFDAIEAIVQTLEARGVDCGGRYDFS